MIEYFKVLYIKNLKIFAKKKNRLSIIPDFIQIIVLHFFYINKS